MASYVSLLAAHGKPLQGDAGAWVRWRSGNDKSALKRLNFIKSLEDNFFAAIMPCTRQSRISLNIVKYITKYNFLDKANKKEFINNNP